jgi:hypothetical protein
LSTFDLEIVPIDYLWLLLFGLKLKDPIGISDQAKATLTDSCHIFAKSPCNSAVEFTGFHLLACLSVH